MMFEFLTFETDNESETLDVIQCTKWNEIMCEHLKHVKLPCADPGIVSKEKPESESE